MPFLVVVRLVYTTLYTSFRFQIQYFVFNNSHFNFYGLSDISRLYFYYYTTCTSKVILPMQLQNISKSNILL